MQATASSWLPLLPVGFGVAATDQESPSNVSASVCEGEVDGLPPKKEPTAVQSDPETQATLLRVLTGLPVGLGLSTIDHVVPSHDSIKVCY